MTTLRFFRGMAVPAANVLQILSKITDEGLGLGDRWSFDWQHPGMLTDLLGKPDLSTKDTRPDSTDIPAVCACGEEMGAAYYAWKHNRTCDNDTPIIVEFDVDEYEVAIDGRDFLVKAFEFGDPRRARPILERAFGSAVLSYAEKAWTTDDLDRRRALCDLARHDLSVVRSHYANTVVIEGRHYTVFRYAFIVKLPTALDSIVRAWSPSEQPIFPAPEISLSSLWDRTP